MKTNAIWIDLSNKDHVLWWNNTGRKLVKVIYTDNIVETATGRVVGKIFVLKGLLKRWVIKKSESFIEGTTKTLVKKYR